MEGINGWSCHYCGEKTEKVCYLQAGNLGMLKRPYCVSCIPALKKENKELDEVRGCHRSVRIEEEVGTEKDCDE